MIAEIQKDLKARGQAPNRTEIVRLDAELLNAQEHEAVVRFSGMLREDDNPEVFAGSFAEVWIFMKENDQWKLAGIQQAH
jgi:predicted lipid-binding transport protein (Tim44 family)